MKLLLPLPTLGYPQVQLAPRRPAAPSAGPTAASTTMSELKRKREDDSCEDEEPGTADATRAAPTAPPSAPTEAAPLTPDTAAAPEPARANEPPTAPETAPNVSGDSGTPPKGVVAAEASAPAPPASPAPAPAPSPSPRAPKQKKRYEPPPAAKIMICGKEITVKHTGGRKKRKHPIETLTIQAYKGQLALACKANNMVSALEIYREMKTKGVQQDLSVRGETLGVHVGGSPGPTECACSAAATDLVAGDALVAQCEHCL